MAKSKQRVVWYAKWQVWTATRESLGLGPHDWNDYIIFVRDLNRLNGRTLV
ncbi:hypothetical protein [Stenotrophomonas phage SB2]|uniref:Uncharacterized protein n=1 Tax=Stenotrophomonas phage SB2 TaxID=3117468 RepID=A0ABZ2GZH3_9CAUD